MMKITQMTITHAQILPLYTERSAKTTSDETAKQERKQAKS